MDEESRLEPAASPPQCFQLVGTSFSPVLPEDAPTWPSGGLPPRRQLSGEEWDSFKPIIQRLYIDENKTFQEVAKILEKDYSFAPTKRQFNHKTLSVWGLRKNSRQRFPLQIKDARVRGGNVECGEPYIPNNVELFPRKKETRPQKPRDSSQTLVTGLTSLLLSNKSASACTKVAETKPASNRSTVNSLDTNLSVSERNTSACAERDSGDESSKEPQTLWDAANITKSPTLSGLVAALKIDDEIPLLPASLTTFSSISLPETSKNGSPEFCHGSITEVGKKCESDERSPDISVPPRKSKKRSQKSIAFDLSQWIRNAVGKTSNPWRTIDPFPTPPKRPMGGITAPKCFAIEKSIKRQRLESEKQLRKLERTLPKYNQGLIAAMDQLAHLYSFEGRFKLAEAMHLRVALSRQRTLGNDHPTTVRSYLGVVLSKFYQVDSQETERIARHVHERIVKLFGETHELAWLSRWGIARLYYRLGNYAEAEKMMRVNVQIVLNEHGMRAYEAADALDSLACTMVEARKYPESITTHLYATSRKIVNELGNERNIKNMIKAFGYQHAITMRIPFWLGRMCRLQGQFERSEKLLREWLVREARSADSTTAEIGQSILELAQTLKALARWEDASLRYEELIRLEVEAHGRNHAIPMGSYSELRHCYAMQGLYNTQELFEERLEMVLRRDGITSIHMEKAARKWGQFLVDNEAETEQERKRTRLINTGSLTIA